MLVIAVCGVIGAITLPVALLMTAIYLVELKGRT